MTESAMPATRLTIFAAVVAAIVVSTGLYLYFTRTESSVVTTTVSDPREDAAQLQSIAKIRQGAHVAFRSMVPGPTYGRLSFVPLDAGAARVSSGVSCNRLYFSDRMGLCLAIVPAPAGFEAYIIDDSMKVATTIGIPGMPSRARVSRNSQFAAYTVFVSGDSYLSTGLSTRTRIVKVPSGDDVADLESFAVVRGGKEIYSIDFNFWGVTFTRDPNRIYATLGTGGRILLVEGDVAERTFHVIAEDIECPSLSPDETHIAFKKRFGSGLDAWWQPAVYDIAAKTVKLLPEPKHIDDQIEWLDEAHILYAVGHSPSAPVRRADVWQLAIDGASPPSIFLPDAESPAVVRP
jgi:hypothetical protein